MSGLGSIHFFQFNSIPIQVGFRIFQFNSIPIQIGFRIFQFNSNSIHFLSIPIQFNLNFMHCNKQINQIIGYFKFNLKISLFAAQFWKYIIQDHKNSRINKSSLVQVLQGSKLSGAEGRNAQSLTLNAPRLLRVGAGFCSLFKIRYIMQSLLFAPVMATFAPRFHGTKQKIVPYP